MREEEIDLNHNNKDVQRFNTKVNSRKEVTRKLINIETHIFRSNQF